MHRRLAAARRDEPDARMRHWLACGEVALAVNAADEAAAEHMGAARFGKAKGAYAAALRAARGCGRDDLMGPLLEGYVEAALCDISLAAANDAEQHAARMAAEPGPRLVALARAFRHGLMGEWANAWSTAAAVAPFRAAGLEGVRLGVMVRAANLGKVADVHALLQECRDVFQGTPTARATHLSWRGLVAYASGEFASALDLQRQALAEGPTLRRRLAILGNLSVALIDSLHLAEAMKLAGELERLGRELRAPGYERWGAAARAEAAYRLRLPLEAMTDDLRRGISGVGNDLTCCNMLLTFAAAAWREGRVAEAQLLAKDAAAAAERVNRIDSGVVPRALLAAAGGEVDAEALLVAVEDPRLHVRQVGQVLALLVRAGVARDKLPQGPLHAVIVAPDKYSETRLEVLDWAEVLAYLGAPPPGNPV
ncbi:hypothetical protein LBMAG42_44590 [Deltaproteobacteria bacterium]|nr:hypothetical protein LBMAG42_44590 [Deltaproteobacteria bacterium]